MTPLKLHRRIYRNDNQYMHSSKMESSAKASANNQNSSLKATRPAPPYSVSALVTGLLGFASLILPSAAQAQYMGNPSPVGLPRFHLSEGVDHMAGKAFAIQWFKGKTLLICPLHLVGLGAGYPTDIEARDVPERVRSVDVYDLKGQSIVASTGPGLLRTGWPVEKGNGNITGDMMAFELKPGSKMPLLPLSPTLVPVGTRVWVLTKDAVSQATSFQPERFAGTVTRSLASGLTIAMEGTLTALGSSGSPVVNARGELVGMMVGKESEARTTVMAIPSTILYQRLCRELVSR